MVVRRGVRREPGANDRWWRTHERKCGGVNTRADHVPEELEDPLSPESMEPEPMEPEPDLEIIRPAARTLYQWRVLGLV